MSETSHPTFGMSIFVNGVKACDCTRNDAPLFVAAYKKMWPEATVETFTTLQMTKRKQAALDAEEEGEPEHD